MNQLDIQREVAKIQDALEVAIQHHIHRDQANAALHLSGGNVRYSPLTTTLLTAKESADRLEDNFAISP